jgi:uncharacterized membrane protein YdjX (TVP38/TMEM64 family)
MVDKLKSRPWLKGFLVIAFLGIIFLTLRFLNIDFSKVTIGSFKERISSFGIWGPVIYIVLYVLRPRVLFPASVFSASAGAIGGLEGLVYLLIGANLSAVTEFIAARYFVRGSVEKLIKGKWSSIDHAVEKRGFVTVLLIRLIPNVPWDIQNLALGLTKVRFRDYALATFVGILPGSFALVYFGSSFISVITDPKHFWKIIAAFIIFGAVYYLQKFLKEKQGASGHKGPITPVR